jgi:hypothetical protein
VSFNLNMHEAPKPVPVAPARRVSRAAIAVVRLVFILALLAFVDAVTNRSAGAGWVFDRASGIVHRWVSSLARAAFPMLAWSGGIFSVI